MVLFSLVFFKVLSALLSVVVGFFAGRTSNINKDSVASLLFYFIAPIVFFSIPTSASLKIDDLTITMISFLICSALGLASFWFYGKIWQDGHRNLLALSSGTGNSGYVVLPIATSIFDEKTLSIYALAIIGVSIYEASLGYYFCARSVSSIRESVIRVARLPILNAFFFGCAMSLAGFRLPDFLGDFVVSIKATFSVLGMIMVGLGISSIREFKVDIKFTAAAFFSKFVVLPLAFNIFIVMDKYIFGWYDSNYYDALQLLSVAPLATNIIVISSLYKIYPEKAAAAVLLSLIFVLFYMPLMATLMIDNVSIS